MRSEQSGNNSFAYMSLITREKPVSRNELFNRIYRCSVTHNEFPFSACQISNNPAGSIKFIS